MEQVNTKLIERYFEGDLDAAELATVSQKLQDDPAFAEAFQLEEDLLAGIAVAGNQALRQRLNAIHETVVVKKDAPVVPMRSRRNWIWLAAAAFIGAVVLGKVLWDGRDKTTEQVYAEYAVHEFDFGEKGTGTGQLANIEQLLDAKEYAKALPLLEAYTKANLSDAEALLALGIVQTELGKTDEALGTFRVVEGVSPLMRDEVMWWRAMIYLLKGDINTASQTLDLISTNSVRTKQIQSLKKQFNQ
jgi:tetratricopeptide (TPR) repeat protein